MSAVHTAARSRFLVPGLAQLVPQASRASSDHSCSPPAGHLLAATRLLAEGARSSRREDEVVALLLLHRAAESLLQRFPRPKASFVCSGSIVALSSRSLSSAMSW